MATPDYGEINPTYTYRFPNGKELQIDSPPDHALLTLRELHRLPYECVEPIGNIIFAGVDFRSPGREHVYYRIVGWDADRKALILHREPS